jgi:hypothetical protein
VDAPVTSVPVTSNNSFGVLEVPEHESDCVETTPLVENCVVESANVVQ